MSHKFFEYCSEHGIHRQMICPGVAESKLAHLTSMCLSWMHSKNLLGELWVAAIQSACHVINRLPPWPGTESSPFEALYHRKPNVSYFRVFDSVCYVHVSKSNRTKLDPRARQCIFVGYDTHRKGWRCMDPKIKKVTVSRDVVFDEVSSYQFSTNMDRGTADLAFFPSDTTSSERGSNVSPSGEISQQAETAIRKSSRQR